MMPNDEEFTLKYEDSALDLALAAAERAADELEELSEAHRGLIELFGLLVAAQAEGEVDDDDIEQCRSHLIVAKDADHGREETVRLLRDAIAQSKARGQRRG